jgi:hypothetical protein
MEATEEIKTEPVQEITSPTKGKPEDIIEVSSPLKPTLPSKESLHIKSKADLEKYLKQTNDKIEINEDVIANLELFLDTLAKEKVIKELLLDMETLCASSVEEACKKLGAKLRDSTQLKVLSLNFQNCTKLSEENLNQIKKGLSDLDQLTALTLNFARCDNITEKGYSKLFNGLSHKLTTLTINLSELDKIGDTLLATLSEALLEIKSLTSLNLNFTSFFGSKITDVGVSKLGAALSRMELTSLHINFTSCAKLTDAAFSKLSEAFAK